MSLTLENSSSVVPPALTEEPRICKLCAGSSSVVPALNLRDCARCSRMYCFHMASKLDTMFCQYCFYDFVMEDTFITKEIKSKSLRGNKIFTRTMKARHIVFKGEAWMFAQQRVVDMTDEELITSIEYHREIYDQMLNEREARNVKKNQLQLKRLIRTSSDQYNPSSGLGVNDVLGMKSTTVKTTRVTKTRVVAQGGNDPQMAIQMVINMLKAQGLSDLQVSQALLAMTGKK